MSSNIRIKKVCQHCAQIFIACTTVTKFCSDNCAKRNYKKRLKEQKITKAILHTNKQLQNNSVTSNTNESIAESKKRELITIAAIAELMGVGARTLFRLLNRDTDFPRLKIGRRLLFNKQEVMNYFISKTKEHEG